MTLKARTILTYWPIEATTSSAVSGIFHLRHPKQATSSTAVGGICHLRYQKTGNNFTCNRRYLPFAPLKQAMISHTIGDICPLCKQSLPKLVFHTLFHQTSRGQSGVQQQSEVMWNSVQIERRLRNPVWAHFEKKNPKRAKDETALSAPLKHCPRSSTQ